jgi:peptidoglycan/xylan/chitin deacetylase (PgdA/CDA1 family)
VAEGSAGRTPVAAGSAERIVHLTFDAEHPNRPHHRSGGAEALLDVLAAHDVLATFFVQGRWASAHPGVAARIAQEGHTIGSHSNAHVRMTRLSDHGITAEVNESQERIRDATGVDPRPYFRCPYGDGHDDARVIAAISALEYRLVGWDIDPEDWNQANSAADLVAAVRRGLAQPPGAAALVVLMHTWPAPTSSALQQLLEAYGEDQVSWAPLARQRHGGARERTGDR